MWYRENSCEPGELVFQRSPLVVCFGVFAKADEILTSPAFPYQFQQPLFKYIAQIGLYMRHACSVPLFAYLLSAHSTMLRLYVRQPGGWFYYIYWMQRISAQKITISITHQDSCQVVCFFIGPGGYRLLQRADNQNYRSFITRQVV